MIATFPTFTSIDLGINHEYNELIREHPPYSDFNFVSLHSWNKGGGGSVSLLHGNVVLQLSGYTANEKIVTFLGTNKPEATLDALLHYAEQRPSTTHLRLIPEQSIHQIKAGPWHIEEDPDNHDYVISLTNLIGMRGSGMRRYRRAVKAFLSTYGALPLTPLDLRDAATQETILDVFRQREGIKQGNDARYELYALTRLLAHAHHHQLVAYGLRIQGSLQAFIICEDVGKGWSIGHFWKAVTTHAGIYAYLMWQTAQQLMQRGVSLMNIEQDLGIEGLRYYKQSFCPVGHLKKFSVMRLATCPAQTATNDIAGGRHPGKNQRQALSPASNVA